MKLTAAQRRALEAVRDSKVWRTYTREGNTISVRGGVVAPVSVYRLEALQLIREAGKGARISGRFSTTRHMELTDAGRRYLWENPQ